MHVEVVLYLYTSQICIQVHYHVGFCELRIWCGDVIVNLFVESIWDNNILQRCMCDNLLNYLFQASKARWYFKLCSNKWLCKSMCSVCRLLDLWPYSTAWVNYLLPSLEFLDISKLCMHRCISCSFNKRILSHLHAKTRTHISLISIHHWSHVFLYFVYCPVYQQVRPCFCLRPDTWEQSTYILKRYKEYNVISNISPKFNVISILIPSQNVRHFSNDILKWIFLTENV